MSAPTDPRLPVLLLLLGLAGLVGGWLAAEPPFVSADETSHYARAISIPAEGLIGEPFPQYGEVNTVLTERQLATVRQEVRQVRLPPGLGGVAGYECVIRDATQSAACQYAAAADPVESVAYTPVGSYPPAAYLLPGVLAARAAGAVAASGVASVVSALTAFGLLAAAAAVAWERGAGRARLLGLAVALTPTVLYTASNLNPSALEIAGAVAAFSGLLLLGPTSGRLPWVVVAVGFAAVLLSRSTGPAWAVVLLLAGVVVRGPRPLVRAAAAQPRAAIAAGVVVGAAAMAAAAWLTAYGTDLPFGLAPFPESLAQSWELVANAVRDQSVAAFGYIEYRVPDDLLLAWQLLAVAVLGAAYVAGSWRDRANLTGAALGAVAAGWLLEAAVLRHSGFGVQGRHVLPALVLVPLLAGDVLARRPGTRPVRALLVLAAAAVPALHGVAWLAAARRYAVGTGGPWRFFGRSDWAPALGWELPFAVACAGAAAVGAALLWLAWWPGAAPPATSPGRTGTACGSAPGGRRGAAQRPSAGTG